MTFFESLLALLFVAVVLLQVARRLHLPYPTMLAAAGLAVAAIPGTPAIPIAPHTALALFIAPVLMDAAYDFPLGAARRLWGPLLVYAVVAVLVTALLVMAVGMEMLSLPVAAALTLGAIVAPPDAAAATAILSGFRVSRRIDAVLKGESLFNDATALLLFTAALTVQQRGGLDLATGTMLGLAAPGGILFGIAFGALVRRLSPYTANTVGGTLLQFLTTFAVWIVAERLHLSAVLAAVAGAMTIAALSQGRDPPRMRVHSYAVWTTLVFALNVLAFLLMGMQVRGILAAMGRAELTDAAVFGAAVVATVIVSRLGIAFVYRAWAVHRFRRRGGVEPVRPAETLLIGWTGMRGLVTLATAFALPADFPQRDTVVLAAFAVVIATLVIQGATLTPLIRRFALDRGDEGAAERQEARVVMAEAALARLADERGEQAEALRRLYRDLRDGMRDPALADALGRRHALALAAVMAQREALERLRDEQRVGSDGYLELQEDLDWKQLSVIGDEDRRIREV